jgi:hypothetical protein
MCLLAIWMKPGVSANGEKWSAIVDEDLNARYGRFQTMKLKNLSEDDDEWEETAIHIRTERDSIVRFILLLLCSTDMSSEPLLANFLPVIQDGWRCDAALSDSFPKSSNGGVLHLPRYVFADTPLAEVVFIGVFPI